jgi:multidrug efflux pump subunit AcrA (membrane-fusion protein)
MLNPLPNSIAFVKLIIPLALLLTLAGAACRSSGTDDNDSSGIVVVSAPAAGVVKRVLVSEGVKVASGAGIVEIALPVAAPAPEAPGESPQARAARTYQSANAEIDAARAEVVRHEAEIQRLTPLVASGQASQGELDGERALYEHAQQRLQRAQTAARDAQTGLVVAQQPGVARQTNANPPPPREQLVTANTTSGGVVTVISVRPGDRVTQGQPVATLRADGQ